jgi:enoyl-CoA hydratase
MPPDASDLRIEASGGVARLTLDRSQSRNALTLDLVDSIGTAMGQLAREGVRVAVIAGAGDRAFSAGFDISAIDGEGTVGEDGLYDNDRRLQAAFRAVEDAPFPVIAAIRGFCLGGGLELAMACDLRLATADARFRMPPAQLGWVYAREGMRRITSAVGVARARHLFLTGEMLNAETAERWGLIHEVVAPEALEARVASLTEAFTRAAPIALEGLKHSLTALAREDASGETWEAHRALRARALGSEDLREGRAAFLERRTARFTGR